MAILEILTDDHPTLRKQAKAIRKFDAELRRLAEDMIETMQAAPGIGLAAPQVGVSRRLIVACDVENENTVYAVVNPKIVRRDGEQTSTEGCLSVPKLVGDVTRAMKVSIKGYDLDGTPFSCEAEGLFARVFQHEVDHLNGILIVQRAISGTLRPPDEDKNDEENDLNQDSEDAEVQWKGSRQPVI